jgi:hypothetical protein
VNWQTIDSWVSKKKWLSRVIPGRDEKAMPGVYSVSSSEVVEKVLYNTLIHTGT